MVEKSTFGKSTSGGSSASAPAAPASATERIAKRLARAGVASRREAERMIEAGRVAVNGAVLTTPAVTVGPKDAIQVDGKPLPDAQPSRVWRYHKPGGLVTSARDEKGRPTVFDRLPAGMPRVMPIGRLDLTSEGLLLLTNDGELKRRLELPSTGWLRKYRARVHGVATPEILAPLRAGVTVDGEKFQPMIVQIDSQKGANAWLTIGIREGKNREIRRALESVGMPVSRLIRISYGPFRLGDLRPGQVEEIKPRVLGQQLGLSTKGWAEAKGEPARPAATRAGGRGSTAARRPCGAAKGGAVKGRGPGGGTGDAARGRTARGGPDRAAKGGTARGGSGGAAKGRGPRKPSRG